MLRPAADGRHLSPVILRKEPQSRVTVNETSPGHFQPPDLKQVYRFIRGNAASWPVHTLCAVLEVSRSAYYGWLSAWEVVDKREEETERLILEHCRRYGVRRLVAELKAQGVETGAYKVRLVLREHRLKTILPRSFVPRTTDSRHPYPINPHLLLGLAFPTALNQVRMGDMPLAGAEHQNRCLGDDCALGPGRAIRRKGL